MFFKSGESKLVGQSVSINEGNKTPEQRYLRAQTRVDNLTGKLRRLKRRPPSPEINNIIAQTQFAIEQWEKRMLIAEYEIKLQGEK